jgi:hypothetical protein
VLGTDDCPRESLVGFAIFPAVTAIGTTEAGSADIATLSDGPFVAKVESSFAHDYMCSGRPQTITGRSIFTFFPSGRIVRQDFNVIPSQTTLEENPTDCGCGFSGDYFFTSFWSFVKPANAQLFLENGNEVANAVVAGGPSGQAGGCTFLPDSQLALAVKWAGTSTRLWPNGAASHVFDFASGVQRLDPSEADVISGMQFAGDCPTAFAGLADPPLVIDENPLFSSDLDGIYRDFGEHDSEFEIRNDGDNPIPAGFAVSIDVDGHARVDRPVFIQREEGTRSLMYFPDPLMPGEAITIVPE